MVRRSSSGGHPGRTAPDANPVGANSYEAEGNRPPERMLSRMNRVEVWVRRLRRRVFLAVFAAEFLRACALLAFLVGALVLVLRYLSGYGASELLPWLWLLVVAVPWALWRARARALDPRTAAVWLDVRSGASGALLTELESPDARWESRLDGVLASGLPLPAPVVLGPFGSAALGLVFAVAAYLVGVPLPDPGPPMDLFEALVGRLGEQLATLEEDFELDSELAEEMASRLALLEEELELGSTESLFEALDHLEGRLESEADRLGEVAREASESLVRALESFDPEDSSAALSTLQKALSELAEGGFGERLSEQLFERLGGVDGEAGRLGELLAGSGLELAGENLNALELLELSQGLSELMQEKLANLRDAGLLEDFDLGEFTKAGGLGEFLSHECDETCELEGEGEGGT